MLQKKTVLCLGLLGALAACSAVSEPDKPASTSGTEPPGSSSGTTSSSSSSSSSSSGSPTDAGPDAPASGDDLDGDGIPDALEAKIAADYGPYLSVHPSDGCARHGVLYRIAPHPKEKGRVMMWFDVLFEKDCGANGHVGDDEMSGIVIDPSKPAPAGILAVRAISHQNTPCQSITTCGSCPGMTACSTGTKSGAAFPVIYMSKDKHGSYVDKGTCSNSIICDFGGCALAAAPSTAPMVNAGEPGKPLVSNLTTAGFVNAKNGWTEAALMNFDPWKAGNFGGAGDVSKDLVDDAFVIDTTACK